MPINTYAPSDLLGQTPRIFGTATLNLASVSAQTLVTLPSIGSQRVVVRAVVLDQPVGATASATASFGSSTTLTDFIAATALGVNFPIVITPTVDQIYTGGVI